MSSYSIAIAGFSLGNASPAGIAAVTYGHDFACKVLLAQHIAEPTSVNRAVLLTAVEAIEALPECAKATIITGLKYVSDNANREAWHGWKEAGWKTADRKPVAHPDLWARLAKACEKRLVHFASPEEAGSAADTALACAKGIAKRCFERPLQVPSAMSASAGHDAVMLPWPLTTDDIALATTRLFLQAACTAVAEGAKQWPVMPQSPAEKLAVGSLLGAGLARELDDTHGIYSLFTDAICQAYRPAPVLEPVCDEAAPDLSLADMRRAIPAFASAADIALAGLAVFASEVLGVEVDVSNPAVPLFCWDVVLALRIELRDAEERGMRCKSELAS